MLNSGIFAAPALLSPVHLYYKVLKFLEIL